MRALTRASNTSPPNKALFTADLWHRWVITFQGGGGCSCCNSL